MDKPGNLCYNIGVKCSKETDYRKLPSQVAYELKKTALRLRRKGKTVAEIAEDTGLAEQTVRNAFKAYDLGGIDAIKPKRRGRKSGEKRHLTPEQEKEIISMLIDHTPDQLKFKCCMWDRQCVKQLNRRKYGIDMPIRTVGEYLKRWGFTVQRPAKQEMEQKPEQVRQWLDEEYPAIRKKAKEENAEIFWGDETAVQNLANYARGYAPCGQTPVLKIRSRKMHINMISAISNQGKLHFLLYSDAINSDRLIEFMQAIIKDAGRKVFLILDNLRVHHSKAVSAWVEEHKDLISLFHLPPYSPEYNPDEYLNHDLKQSIGTQQMVSSVEELHDHATGFMSHLAEDPDHVKSYFEHPKVKQYEG